jgi:hypothetical protein
MIQPKVGLDAGGGLRAFEAGCRGHVGDVLNGVVQKPPMVDVNALWIASSSGCLFESPYSVRIRRDQPPREVAGETPDAKEEPFADGLSSMVFVDDELCDPGDDPGVCFFLNCNCVSDDLLINGGECDPRVGRQPIPEEIG